MLLNSFINFGLVTGALAIPDHMRAATIEARACTRRRIKRRSVVSFRWPFLRVVELAKLALCDIKEMVYLLENGLSSPRLIEIVEVLLL